MENQERLDKEIGTKEIEKLKPEKVKIEKVEVITVGEGKKKADKVTCYCTHPAQEDPIKISSVEYLKGKNVVTMGIWYKEDAEGKLQKGSVLTSFLDFVGAKTIRDLEGKEIMTTEDDKGYLCFKAY